MGFHSKWVNLMMQCVISVTYSIKINGKPRGHITPTRGLRQGDPYLPFCSCFVQKDFQLYFAKPLALVFLKVSLPAHEAHVSHTSSSPMIVSSFVKQP